MYAVNVNSLVYQNLTIQDHLNKAEILTKTNVACASIVNTEMIIATSESSFIAGFFNNIYKVYLFISLVLKNKERGIHYLAKLIEFCPLTI